MRARFDDENCAVARTLDILGDGWTLLIIREAFLGTRRFADFHRILGVARNILSDRLQHLVDHDILETVDAGRYGRRLEYRLTARGKDLVTILTALRQWGDRWIFGEGAEPMLVLDRRTGRPVPRVRVTGEDGEPLRGRDLVIAAGPGATRATRERFAANDDD